MLKATTPWPSQRLGKEFVMFLIYGVFFIIGIRGDNKNAKNINEYKKSRLQKRGMVKMQKISVSTEIKASKEKIWSIITNIEDSANTISGIHKIEIIEKGTPFKGLKWRETREMFGKKASELMWIHDCTENESHNVRAESHGSKYYTDFYLSENENSTTLTMEFSAEIISPLARFVNSIFGWMFKNATIKALQVDLDDIKKVSEQ